MNSENNLLAHEILHLLSAFADGADAHETLKSLESVVEVNCELGSVKEAWQISVEGNRLIAELYTIPGKFLTRVEDPREPMGDQPIPIDEAVHAFLRQILVAIESFDKDVRNKNAASTLLSLCQKSAPMDASSLYASDSRLWSHTSAAGPHEKWNPLFAAVINRCRDETVAALEGGANPNQQWDEELQTPLMTAAELCEDSEHVVAVLLEHGAQVNITNRDENTALHLAVLALQDECQWAAEQGKEFEPNLNTVKLLLSHGADPEMTNLQGQSPRSLAESLPNLILHRIE